MAAFRKIRTITTTQTYVETMYKALKRLEESPDCTPEEKARINKIRQTMERQTGFKAAPDPADLNE